MLARATVLSGGAAIGWARVSQRALPPLVYRAHSSAHNSSVAPREHQSRCAASSTGARMATPAAASGGGAAAGDDFPTLVSADWLLQHLGEPGIKVLDATWYLVSTRRTCREVHY